MQNCSCMVIDGDYDDDKAMVMTDIVTIMTVVAKAPRAACPERWVQGGCPCCTLDLEPDGTLW